VKKVLNLSSAQKNRSRYNKTKIVFVFLDLDFNSKEAMKRKEKLLSHDFDRKDEIKK
jgi:hypothetical protein